MAEKIEVVEEDVSTEPNTLLSGLRQVLLAGVGAVALAQEEVEDFVNKLIERGEIAEKDGRKLVNDVRERRKSKAQASTQRLEEEVERRMESLLNRMNVPSKSDIEKLNAKITELTQKVDALKKSS